MEVFMAQSPVRKSNSSSLLTQLISNNQFIQEVQNLNAEVVHKIVRHIGLEDASEFLMLLSSQQMQEVLDQDIWKSPRPGVEDQLDAERFCTWLEMLLEISSDFAAEKVSEMDDDLLTAALAEFVLVMDSDELALMTRESENDLHSENKYLEKVLESTFNLEIEGFLVMSKAAFQWEVISNLLSSLQKNHYDILESVLVRLNGITLSQIDEADGLYNLLKESEILKDSLSYERQQKREKEGFVSASSAVAFLKLIEQTPLEKVLENSEQDHISKMYFRQFKPGKIRPAQPLSKELLLLLKAHGVQNEVASSLQLPSPNSRASSVRGALVKLREESRDLFEQKILELNFLANVLLAGHSPTKKHLRPVEAMELALKTCDRGAAYLQKNKTLWETLDLLQLFKIGWKNP